MLRVRSILTRPWVSAAILALLLYSLWRVPSADTSACSVRGWTLPGIRVGKAERISPTSVFLVRSGEGFRVEDIDRASTQGLIDSLARNPDDVVRAVLIYERHARGLYDVTSFFDEFTIELRPIGGRTLTADEASRARATFVGWLALKNGGNMSGISEAISGVAPPRLILNAPGIVNTLFALIGWPLFALSLGWVPPAVREAARRRRQRALSEGRCPRCGYEIYGIQGGVCPECGKPLQAG